VKDLLTSIATKIVGSALSTDVGGRIYLDQAPEDANFPYVVCSVVSDVPERTFTELFEDIMLQFSLFSSSSGSGEIATIYADLNALFDECSFTITGNTLVWMRRASLTTMTDDMTTPAGTVTLKHWAVDYSIKTSLN
jgi:Protein of unknown function (DUF3168)